MAALRAACVGVHFAAGLATTTLVFPLVSADLRRRLIRRWSARLLDLLAIDVRVEGQIEAPHGNVLIVANHVSWLDVFVLLAKQPVRFVAKSELAEWPLAGRLIRDTGAIFVERERRHDTRRVNHHAARALASGDVIAVFPEGTTTAGDTLLKFHASLLQPIVEARGHLLPVAIRYRDARGAPSAAAAYVGDDSFAASFWRVCSEPGLVVELRASATLSAQTMHRRELARAAELAIRTALGLPDAAKEPDTRDGRAA